MKRKPLDDTLDRALTTLYQTDVPESFKASWRDAVKREESPHMKPTPRLTWLRRAALPIAAAVVLLAGTAITGIIAPQTPAPERDTSTGMNQATYTAKTAGTAENMSYDLASEAMLYSADPAPATATSARGYADDEVANGLEDVDELAIEPRKIVRTYSLTISTTLFEQDYAAILSLADTAGGYASSVGTYEQQIDRRFASFELRIPSEAIDGFLDGLELIGRVTDRFETSTDKTVQYADTSLRLKTQQDKMTRLRELLLEAETVEDLLAIESEIADTQYEMDSLQTSLNVIDRQVDYTTVNVSLREQTASDTAAAQDLTIGERLVNGWKASLNWLGGFFENMLVFLTAAAPVLIPLIVGYIIYRLVRKHRKTKKQP